MNKRKRLLDADDAANVKRLRMTSTEAPDIEGHLSSGLAAGLTVEEQAEATSIADTVLAVCLSLVDRICEKDASENEDTRIVEDSSKTIIYGAESETAEKSDYVDESILRSYEYYFGED